MAYDSIYDEEQAAFRRRQQRLKGNIAYERGQVQREYGFDDASDPYNRANMLERAYKQRTAAITGGLASRGQLYSGAHLGGQEEARYGHERSVAQTRAEYLDRLRGLTEREAGAQEEYGTSELGARREAMGRAIEGARGEEPPLAPAPAAPGGGLSQDEYLRRLRAIRARHGANSPEVDAFRRRHGR